MGHLIDLQLNGRESVACAFLLDTPEGPALVDCGPTTSLGALKDGLAAHGLQVSDLRHILLTHIHLDHAGAAGVLVRENPRLMVHVSEVGLFHVAYPVALEYSARGVYGDRFDELWGELAPVPEANLRTVGSKVVGLECFPTPGHASHHVSYLTSDGTLFAGDAAGVRILPGRQVTPPTPPPDIDVEHWLQSIEEIGRRQPARLALSHFGIADDPAEHLAELVARLTHWNELVRDGMTEAEFVDFVEAEISAAGEQAGYHETLPPDQLYRGLSMYAAREQT